MVLVKEKTIYQWGRTESPEIDQNKTNIVS